ncbi:CpaF family protein [Promicromonospora sp. MS192]|uniref:CpaF family protein n=1 Tax=Promicromonospora sp. MS192 TaxID=3412684 RepID=UPI003C2F731D
MTTGQDGDLDKDVGSDIDRDINGDLKGDFGQDLDNHVADRFDDRVAADPAVPALIDISDPGTVPLLTRPVPRPAPAPIPTTSNPWVAPASLPERPTVSGARGVGASVAPRWDGGTRRYLPPVDWELVADLRKATSAELTRLTGQRVTPLPVDEQRERGREIITRLVERTVADRVNTPGSSGTLTAGEQEALIRAVFDHVFRLGRLQPLVDDDRVENIMINGCDTVRLELKDGTHLAGPPVAESDEELIEFLQSLASRSQVNAREFSPAREHLDLTLDGGERLAATAFVTPRPVVVIRRHRLLKETLDDLVGRDMLTPVAASFLGAAVRARKSIVVSGAMGAGKTTLLRALCQQIGADEYIGTYETDFELHLQEIHPNVFPFEERRGIGELTADGRRAGASTLGEAIDRSFRMNLSRQIVGEVRGKEAWPMIKVMESGTGSLSTTHATSAVGAIHKLAGCAMEHQDNISYDLALMKLAATVDVVVHLDYIPVGQDLPGDRPRRRVREIVAVAPGENLGVATTHVFAPDATGTAVPGTLPDQYRALERAGFDLAAYLHAQEVLA